MGEGNIPKEAAKWWDFVNLVRFSPILTREEQEVKVSPQNFIRTEKVAPVLICKEMCCPDVVLTT